MLENLAEQLSWLRKTQAWKCDAGLLISTELTFGQVDTSEALPVYFSGKRMPSLLSAPSKAVSEIHGSHTKTVTRRKPQDAPGNKTVPTYITPAIDAPRASQMAAVDLSASSGSSTLSGTAPTTKRPPTSPRKPKLPPKRRNVNQIDDSDDDDLFEGEDMDEDAYMNILDETSRAQDDSTHFVESAKSPYFKDAHDSKINHSVVPNSPAVPELFSPTRLSRELEGDLSTIIQSPPKVVREDTPSMGHDLELAEATTNSTRPPLANLGQPPPYIATPASARRVDKSHSLSSGMNEDSERDLIQALRAEHMHLKAEMTEIVEDEGRGPYCSEAKANKARREQIQAQLATLVVDKASLQKKLEALQQSILADVMAGIMPTEQTKREVQLLTENIKMMEENGRSSRYSSTSSVPPPAKLPPSPPRSTRPISGRLSEHNQLAHDTFESPRISTTPHSIGRQLFQERADFHGSTTQSEVHNFRTTVGKAVSSTQIGSTLSNNRTTRQLNTLQSKDVIELISDDDDEDDTTTNMGFAVDFNEDDFSDGIDYAAENDIEAQRARYEELSSQRYDAKLAREHSRTDMESSRAPGSQRTKMLTSSRRGPLDTFMKPTQEHNLVPATEKTRSTEPSNIMSKSATYVSASPTQIQVAHRPAATQRIAQTQIAPRVARPTARPVDLMSLPGMDKPWSKDVVTAMNEVFKLRYFRSNQLEAINATLSGRDAFVLMPTGGGKSLCYQLPSIITSGATRGVTVVVSPLVSLMQDQVDHLEAINIRAASFNSDKTISERSEIMRQMLRGELDCIYVAPEMLAKSAAINSVFKQLWERESLARIVIDEAHCVSQWGHDFRPDYKKLGDFRKDYEGVPVIALTATANDKVQVDVKNHLELNNPACFKQSFNRPNLHYYVYPRTKGSNDKIKDLLDKTHKGQIGIIYCLSRAKCEAMAQQLGRRAGFYHAGMKKDERADIQRLWQAGTIQVIVATIAFGMGIDKPDVRFVIHTSLPKSLEGYYQETGRAGRDGRRADCYLFWAFADKMSLEKMIDRGESEGQKISPAQKRVQKEGIQRVVDYADNKADCRRAQVLGFFNEAFDVANCHRTCDNCQSEEVYTDQDVTKAGIIAARIARAIANSGDNDKDRRATLNDMVAIARGSKAARITEKGWDQIDGFEGLKSDSRWDIANTTKLFQHLVAIEVLTDKHVPNAMGFTTTYSVPGPKINMVMAGKMNVTLKIQSPRSKKPGISRSSSRQSRMDSMDDFILDDEEIDDFSDVTSGPAPPWPSNLQKFRHNPLDGPAAKKSMPPPASKARRERDSHGEMMNKMYKRTFTPLDLDRIARCWADLKQVRNTIQLKQGHRRLESTFSDQILQDIAVLLPVSISELLNIADIRREVAEAHGFLLLQVTNKYQEEIDALGPVDIAAQGPATKVAEPRQAVGQSRREVNTSRTTSKRTNTINNRPNYQEPYFQERDDDEEDYFMDDEEENVAPQTHHFEGVDQTPTITTATKDKRRASGSKHQGTSKHKSRVHSQQMRKGTSGGTKKSSGGTIGAAKARF